MKVLLIDPCGWQKGGVNLGLAYLAGVLLGGGHPVRILDLNNYNYNLKDIIDGFDPDIIGYSIKTATVKSAKEISRWIKKMYADKIQVAGGPHVTLSFREFLLENPQIDFAFLKEGEIAFAKFVDNFSNKMECVGDIDGIAFRKDNEIVSTEPRIIEELKDIPFPRLDVIININYSQFPYPLLTSRGCPYGCVFCCVGVISGCKWRPRSPDHVIEELKRAKEVYGFKRFEILDDNFTLDIRRAKEICNLILKERLHFSWYCHNGIRADRLDLELAQLMKKAGCESCAIGIETADPEIFKNINKGEVIEDVIMAVELIKKAGMKAVGYFIIGLPGDNLEKVNRTIEFQNSLDLDDFMYNMLIPYPGTKLWDYVQKEGILLMDIQDISHFTDHIKVPFETPDFPQADRKKAYELAVNQAEFQAKRLKTFFANLGKTEVSRILISYFDENIYKIIRVAYPYAELTIFSSQKDFYSIQLLKKDDENIRFIEETIMLGLRKRLVEFDFALFALRDMFNLIKISSLIFSPVEAIVIHRSPHRLKPFQRLILIKKLFIFSFVPICIFFLLISWLEFFVLIAFTKLCRSFKSIR